MLSKAFLCLTLFGANAAMAVSSGFLLGVDYSEWADPTASQIATGTSANLYMLSFCANPNVSCVTKISGDGKTILWQNALGFTAAAMAVDPNGGVYVTPFVAETQPLNPFVEKLSADGAGVAWKAPIGNSLTGTGIPLAVDSTGRAFCGCRRSNHTRCSVRSSECNRRCRLHNRPQCDLGRLTGRHRR